MQPASINLYCITSAWYLPLINKIYCAYLHITYYDNTRKKINPKSENMLSWIFDPILDRSKTYALQKESFRCFTSLYFCYCFHLLLRYTDEQQKLQKIHVCGCIVFHFISSYFNYFGKNIYLFLITIRKKIRFYQ